MAEVYNLEYYRNKFSINKSQAGLSNVDNTSDMDKPVSTAQQTALDSKLNKNLFSSYPSLPNGTPTMLNSGSTYEMGFQINRIFLMTLFNPYNESHVYIVETGSTSNYSKKCKVTKIAGTGNYFTITPLTLTTLNIKCDGAFCYPTYFCIGGV